MRRPALPALPFLAALAAACASQAGGATERPTVQDNIQLVGTGMTSTLSSVTAETPEVRSVGYAVNDVWRVLPAVYETMGIPVTSVDPAAHVIGNSSIKARRKLGTVPLSRYLDCGQTQGSPSADSYDVLLSVVTRVNAPAAGADGSTVITTVEATARPVSFAGENVRCASTGALESRLVQLIGVQLQK